MPLEYDLKIVLNKAHEKCFHSWHVVAIKSDCDYLHSVMQNECLFQLRKANNISTVQSNNCVLAKYVNPLLNIHCYFQTKDTNQNSFVFAHLLRASMKTAF